MPHLNTPAKNPATNLEVKALKKNIGASSDHPLLLIIVEDEKRYLSELEKLTDGLSHLPLNYRILFVSDKKKKHTLKNSYSITKSEVAKFLDFAHMVLFFDEKVSKTELKNVVEAKAVPIVHEDVTYLSNYTGPDEEGHCFKFKEMNSWSAYASIVRALENFGFPYDWKNIIKAAKRVL